jgi:hypothetical protein
VLSSEINLQLQDGTDLSGNLSVKKASTRFNNSTIISPVPEKRKNIPDVFN